jgi:hypothetical protein
MDKLVKQRLNKPAYGLILGLILPFIVVLVMYFIQDNKDMSLINYIKYLTRMGTFLPMLSLTTLINLIPFYLFKRLEMWYINKGIVFSIFLYVLLVVFLKFVNN